MVDRVAEEVCVRAELLAYVSKSSVSMCTCSYDFKSCVFRVKLDHGNN